MIQQRSQSRLPQSRPPRKVEFKSEVTGPRDDRYRTRILCTAHYGLRRFHRFVWWQTFSDSLKLAEGKAASALQAAHVVCGGAR